MHVFQANVLNFPAADFAAARDRELLIREMASHLVAGALGPLDLSSDFDVIRYLRDTPERYLAKTITAHMDAAVHLALETIAAAAEGLR